MGWVVVKNIVIVASIVCGVLSLRNNSWCYPTSRVLSTILLCSFFDFYYVDLLHIFQINVYVIFSDLLSTQQVVSEQFLGQKKGKFFFSFFLWIFQGKK
jgi:hypothetical protein